MSWKVVFGLENSCQLGYRSRQPSSLFTEHRYFRLKVFLSLLNMLCIFWDFCFLKIVRNPMCYDFMVYLSGKMLCVLCAVLLISFTLILGLYWSTDSSFRYVAFIFYKATIGRRSCYECFFSFQIVFVFWRRSLDITWYSPVGTMPR